MNKWFQANDCQFLFEIVKFRKVGYRRCDGCLYKELRMLSHKCCDESRIYNRANILKCYTKKYI